MKFIGKPGMLVRDKRKKKNYRFDKDGFLETDNPRLIRALSVKFSIFDGEEIVSVTRANGHKCPHCGKLCKTPSGFASHLKACKGA